MWKYNDTQKMWYEPDYYWYFNPATAVFSTNGMALNHSNMPKVLADGFYGSLYTKVNHTLTGFAWKQNPGLSSKTTQTGTTKMISTVWNHQMLSAAENGSGWCQFEVDDMTLSLIVLYNIPNSQESTLNSYALGTAVSLKSPMDFTVLKKLGRFMSSQAYDGSSNGSNYGMIICRHDDLQKNGSFSEKCAFLSNLSQGLSNYQNASSGIWCFNMVDKDARRLALLPGFQYPFGSGAANVITVHVYQADSGNPAGYMEWVTDGKKSEQSSSQTSTDSGGWRYGFGPGGNIL